MQQLLICLVAGTLGAIAGFMQWRFYMTDPSMKKAIGTHLADLRLHWLIAIAATLVVAGLLAVVLDWLQVLRWSPSAFLLSWIGAVALNSWRFLHTSPADSTRNHEAKGIADQLISTMEGRRTRRST